MSQADLVAHARLQASHRDEQMSGQVAGGRLLAGFLQIGQAVVKDLGTIRPAVSTRCLHGRPYARPPRGVRGVPCCGTFGRDHGGCGSIQHKRGRQRRHPVRRQAIPGVHGGAAGWLGRRVLQSGGRIKPWRIDRTGQGEGWAAQASVLADGLHRPGDAGGTGRTIRRGCTSSAAPAPNGAHKTPSFIVDPGCRAGHPALDRRAPVIALGGTAQASGARSPFRPSTRWPRKLGM